MKSYLSLIITLSLTSVCAWCQTDPSPQGVGSIDFSEAIQLTVGNNWVYEVVETDLETGEFRSLEDEIISILDTLRYKNKLAYVMASNQQYFFERTLTNSGGDLIDIYTDEVVFSSKARIIKEDDYHIIKMELARDTITIPVGSFKTIVYTKQSKQDPLLITSHYYAHGIGLVKQCYTWDGKVKEHNLKDYNLK